MLVFSKFRFGRVDEDTGRDPRVTGYVPIPLQARQSLSLDLAYSALAETSHTSILAVYVAGFKDEQWRDWYSFSTSGTDAEAYLRTGHMTFGDSARMKYAPWLTIEFERTEISVSGS